MAKRLVIVESPTKAKTLRRFLGKDYIVESSVGHIRDLPASAADIPASVKQEPWSRLGINVEKDFEPLYVIASDKKKIIRTLKERLKDADELLLATDEDREGEAISWHLIEVLKPKVPMRRMVFHEITKEAVLAALDHTRDLDRNLVEAYRARRVIDRLYGYEVSPILWRKIAPRLSAGRVQSVAIRILVERELARMRFTEARYWDLSASFASESGASFPARLVTIDGRRLAQGKDFDPDTGKLARDDVVLLDQAAAERLVAVLRAQPFAVAATEEKPFSQSPAPPFTTSTMQQEGGRKLGFNARRTMRAAQRLYELGHITYMRTDSVALSPEALRTTRDAIVELFGREYLPEQPIQYRNKVKNAQEAHEAIRPAGEAPPTPAELAGQLGRDEQRLYELVWKRTMACQMKKARGRRLTVQVRAEAEGREVLFQANGKVIDFHGFLRAYVEGSDDPEAALADREVILPPVAVGDPLRPQELVVEDHATQPPARLTEASLVKALEESGVGRPSTYASIIDAIQRREYTFKKGSALVPTFTAMAVVRLMTEHLDYLVDLGFTMQMEDRLDTIARGEHNALPYLREFYFGDGMPGLRPLLDQKTQDIDPRTVCTIPLGAEENGEPIVVRVGRYGPFLQCGEQTAPLPDGICPDELCGERTREILALHREGPQALGQHPDNGEPVYVKVGRYGPYVQLGDRSDDGKTKPKMVSLLPGMTPETMTLEVALELLALPRTLGQDADGVDVLAHYGRYGAYIKRGSDTRSVPDGESVLAIELARALELLAQEKRRGRRAMTALKTWEGVEALGGKDIKLLKGRYGPYVSDGEINASLPRDIEDPTGISEADAVQLILDRQARGPARKKGARKKTARKKAARKKTVRKKTATKKTATKKRARKKTARKKTVRKKTVRKKTARKTAAGKTATRKKTASP